MAAMQWSVRQDLGTKREEIGFAASVHFCWQEFEVCYGWEQRTEDYIWNKNATLFFLDKNLRCVWSMWQCASQIWPQGNATWSDWATAKAAISASDRLLWGQKMYWSRSCKLTQEENVETQPPLLSQGRDTMTPSTAAEALPQAAVLQELCSCCSGLCQSCRALRGQHCFPLSPVTGARGWELLHCERRQLPARGHSIAWRGLRTLIPPCTYRHRAERSLDSSHTVLALSSSTHGGLGHHQLMGRYSENCFHSWTPEMPCNEL